MKLYLIRGPSGTGKTTLANTLVSHGCADVALEADMYFMGPRGYNWQQDLLHRAHGWCQDTCDRFVASGKTVVIANTLTTIKELRPYFFIADKYGIEVDVTTLGTIFGNVHNVPEDTVARQRDRMAPHDQVVSEFGDFTTTTPDLVPWFFEDCTEEEWARSL